MGEALGKLKICFFMLDQSLSLNNYGYRDSFMRFTLP